MHNVKFPGALTLLGLLAVLSSCDEGKEPDDFRCSLDPPLIVTPDAVAAACKDAVQANGALGVLQSFLEIAGLSEVPLGSDQRTRNTACEELPDSWMAQAGSLRSQLYFGSLACSSSYRNGCADFDSEFYGDCAESYDPEFCERAANAYSWACSTQLVESFCYARIMETVNATPALVFYD